MNKRQKKKQQKKIFKIMDKLPKYEATGLTEYYPMKGKKL